MDYYKSSAEKADTEMEPLLESSELSTQCEEGASRRGRWHRFRHGKTSKRRKAFRFIVAGILTFIFTRFIVCDVSKMVRVLKDRHGRDVGEKDITTFISQSLKDSESDESLPEGISITNCVPWAQAAQQAHSLPHRFTSSASLTLASIPEKLFVISRGPLSTGLIRIVPSDSDQIGLSTTVQFNRKGELNQAKLCILQGADGEIGVGLLSRQSHRRRRHSKHGLHFDITLQLPTDVSFKSLVTDTPFLAHLVDDLSSSVYFESVTLGSKFMPVFVKGIAAETGVISSGFGPIEGNFIANGSLVLSTDLGPIKANVTLINSNEESPTSVLLKSSKSPITANLTLISTSGSELAEGGAFKVDSEGAVSPTTLNFFSAPLKSSLDLDVSTSVSPAKVSLHSTYEGTFDLVTSLAASTVHYDENEEDPEGDGRKRRLIFDKVDWSAKRGSVEWEDEGKERGSVVIRSSIAPVDLFF